jgi:dynein heavy chain
VSQVAEEYLEDYNSVIQSPMRLVMFLDAIEHVSRVCRVIRLPLGNALLLGVGGSGVLAYIMSHPLHLILCKMLC